VRAEGAHVGTRLARHLKNCNRGRGPAPLFINSKSNQLLVSSFTGKTLHMELAAVIQRGAEAKLTQEKPFPRSEILHCLRNRIFSRVVTLFRSVVMVIQSSGTAIRREFRLENRMEIFGCFSNIAFLCSGTFVYHSVQA